MSGTVNGSLNVRNANGSSGQLSRMEPVGVTAAKNQYPHPTTVVAVEW